MRKEDENQECLNTVITLSEESKAPKRVKDTYIGMWCSQSQKDKWTNDARARDKSLSEHIRDLLDNFELENHQDNTLHEPMEISSENSQVDSDIKRILKLLENFQGVPAKTINPIPQGPPRRRATNLGNEYKEAIKRHQRNKRKMNLNNDENTSFKAVAGELQECIDNGKFEELLAKIDEKDLAKSRKLKMGLELTDEDTKSKKNKSEHIKKGKKPQNSIENTPLQDSEQIDVNSLKPPTIKTMKGGRMK